MKDRHTEVALESWRIHRVEDETVMGYIEGAGKHNVHTVVAAGKVGSHMVDRDRMCGGRDTRVVQEAFVTLLFGKSKWWEQYRSKE